jgi:hypothetical protein
MHNSDLYIKYAELPQKMKEEVHDFVDFLLTKGKKGSKPNKPRQAGLAKGLIAMKENFDDPIGDFKEYR